MNTRQNLKQSLTKAIRALTKRVESLEVQVAELRDVPNPNRVIGPKSGRCGLCGNSPCTCEQAARDLETYLEIQRCVHEDAGS